MSSGKRHRKPVDHPSKQSKIERLRKAALPPAIVGNPDDLIHLEWEKEWRSRHIVDGAP